MGKRDFTSTRAKEKLLSSDLKEELKRFEQYQLPKEVVDKLFDSSAKMADDIAKKEAEIAIRLYLLRAVLENITLRQAIIKYKVQTASTSNIPKEYKDGYPTLIQKMQDNQLFNTYESYVRLVQRGPIDNAEEINWKDIENDFITFLTKGLEV